MLRVIYRYGGKQIATILWAEDGVTTYSEYTHACIEGAVQEVLDAATALGLDVDQIQEFLNTQYNEGTSY